MYWDEAIYDESGGKSRVQDEEAHHKGSKKRKLKGKQQRRS